ncbi:unnamed protein product [Penicillium salamii]|uniref:AMP-dependent synthetase/ligase domain-containing protein n=1 Tax=Penicillium salamii TaxID=1612424 RepID=A0A9W4I4K9_9EURO|nr:unnamed protein product [Penicillium salamii]
MVPHFSLQMMNGCARLKTYYNGDCFDHRLIHHLSRQFEHVTQQFSTLPIPTAMSQLSFCSSFDRDRIMEWNSRPPPCVEDVITARFDMQVRSQPAAPAICSWDGNYTYQELHEYSNRLTQKIKSHIRDGQIVLLCFDKSAAAIISMIAVLRAGGACASTSSAHPIERQRAMFETCDAKMVLCSPN